jgi:hypothetical protein
MRGLFLWWPWTPAELEALSTVWAALAATGALVAAGVLVFRDREQVQMLRSEASERAQREVRAQASRVTIRPSDPWRPPGSHHKLVYRRLVVDNRSDGSVHDLRALRVSRVASGHGDSLQVAACPVLGPHDSFGERLPEGVLLSEVTDLSLWCLDFTDAHGRRWRRRADGSLDEKR